MWDGRDSGVPHALEASLYMGIWALCDAHCAHCLSVALRASRGQEVRWGFRTWPRSLWLYFCQLVRVLYTSLLVAGQAVQAGMFSRKDQLPGLGQRGVEHEHWVSNSGFQS